MEIEGIKVHQSNINKKAPLDKKQYADCTYKPQTPPKCFYFGPYNPQMFGILPNFKLAETVSTAPVSFKGAVLKKTDFKGSDLAVIEIYKINPQQLKSKEDLQTCAEDEIRTIILKPELSKDIATLKQVQGDDLKDFGGRQEETKIQRKAMLKEWFDYVIKENDAYSNTQRLIILSAITKGLNDDNDTLPPVLNKGVLAKTVTELEKKLEANPKNFNFNKMYQNNLRTSLMEDSSTGETMTGWVVIPSKTNDPENFEKNVEKLKTLSRPNWCTKSLNAEPYLSQGDFHVYLENGNPKLGVRFVGDEVQEIQGEKNNGKIPHKYLETFKEHQKEYDMKLSYQAQSEVKNAEAVKVELQKVKQELGSAVELKTIDDAIKIFDYAEIEVEKKDDMLVISEYRQPDKNLEYDFEDLGIDENELIKYVTKIKGNANFYNSKITDLGQLQSIGGHADFRWSKITDLGQLQSIAENAYFYNSKITDLGQLQSIGCNANFRGSKITNLGQLQSIGYCADFSDSQITDLGQIESIGGHVDFSDSQITDLGNLQSIGGSANFENSKVTNLGNLQSIGDDAHFTGSQVTDLGQLQSIGGGVDFRDSQITDLGDLQSIGGNAYFQRSKLINLGKLQSIAGDADFTCSKIESAPKLDTIGGELKADENLRKVIMTNLKYLDGKAVDKNQEIDTQDELNKPIEQISTVENEEELNTEAEENLTRPEQPQQPKQTFLSVVKNIIKKFVQWIIKLIT